jgi:hypothetical protein
MAVMPGVSKCARSKSDTGSDAYGNDNRGASVFSVFEV